MARMSHYEMWRVKRIEEGACVTLQVAGDVSKVIVSGKRAHRTYGMN
jgi:hypothetical protein